MKKTTLYLAMAALLLASCSKNEVSDSDMPLANDPNQISFNSTTGTTRAVANDLTAVKAGFPVLGLKDGKTAFDDAFIKGDALTSTYKFNGVTTKWGWTDPIGKEWPTVDAEYPLTFYAEYPETAMTALSKAIEIPLGMDLQKDVLVAKSVVATRPANGFTKLQFKHILSNLVFQIETKVGYTVHIQSIRVVNTATKGRTYDYATEAYEGAEPVYTTFASTDGTYKTAEGFFFNKNTTTAGNPWSFKADDAAHTVGIVTAENGIMMQMPQLTIPYWVDESGQALETFKTDAKAWKDAGSDIAKWFAETVANKGMKGSEGWKGARVEVIYRVHDGAKSIIGRANGEEYTAADGSKANAAKDLFVRVGFPLDLRKCQVAAAAKGWEMNKRYTYTIQLGSASASGGILLDPAYSDNAGETIPTIPVENPKTDPGNPITPGLIGFDVDVDNWTEGTGGDIK